MNVLFLGPSGSGKDTQAELLVEQLGFTRVSTGDLMRDISDGEKDIQKMIRQAMNQGFLADNFVFGLTEIYLQHIKTEDIILSGSVRKDSQVELLDFTLFKVGKTLDKVIYFDLSDEESIKRMSGRLYCSNCYMNYHKIFNSPKRVDICDNCGSRLEQRDDDNTEAIKKRLIDFHKDNTEIIEQYVQRGILIKIDASKSIEEINAELLEILR